MADHIAGVAKAYHQIPFVIRWARPVRGVVGLGGHVFLIPDEGFEPITALHGQRMGGRILTVNEAVPQTPRSDSGSYRGNGEGMRP